MHELRPGLLWIGHAGDLRDRGILERHDIRALIHLALEEPSPQISRELLCCHVPLMDGANPPGMLVAAIEITASLIRSGVPTLVCCSAGMSRSPAIVTAALAVVEGGDPQEVLHAIIQDRPHDVSPVLWEAVCAILREHQERRVEID